MIVNNPSDKDRRVDTALLFYWSNWMRQKKSYLKHVQRVHTSLHPGKHPCVEAKRVHSEIQVLKDCIFQVHIIQGWKNAP
jgi:hypothetical protein